jgi:hypothetical protein
MLDRIKIHLRRIPLKRTIFGLAILMLAFLIVSVVLVVRPVRTVKAQLPCSDSTLRGNYAWTEFGYEPENTPPEFWTANALVNFDGKGKVTWSHGWQVVNGAYVSPTNASFDGTYSVNPDCTLTISYILDTNSYVDHGVVVGAEGTEVVAVDQGPENTGQVDIKKVLAPE